MQNFFSSRLVKDILTVASGAASAQIILLVFSPIITRIFGPEVFGVQGIFLAAISILSPMIALRIPMAIVTCESDRDAVSIASLSLCIAATIAVLMQAVLLLGGSKLIEELDLFEVGSLIYALPLALILVAWQEVCDYTAARQGAFRAVAKVSVLTALISNTGRVIGGLISPVATVLVTVTTLSPALYSFLLKRSYKISSPEIHRLTWRRAWALFRSNLDFAYFRMPTDVINAASQSVPVILLAYFYSAVEAGLYVLARSVVNLPINVLGSALGHVLYARFAELLRESKPLFPIAVQATFLQLLIPGFLLLFVSLFFPALFSTVFGEQWRASGDYAQWMALWIVGMLANVPSVRALPVINKQGWHLVFNSLILLGGILGLYVGYNLGDNAESAVMWYSCVTAFLYVIQVITYLWLVYRFDSSVRSI